MKQKELEQFLHFLNHNKTLTKSQRKKYEQLLARDCAPSEVITPAEQNEPAKQKIVDDTIRIHNPDGVISFLRQFSIDDSLKWYTHKWDTSDPFSFEDMASTIKSNQAKLKGFCFGKNNVGVPAPLYYHVWNFICPNKTNVIKDQHEKIFPTKWADTKQWCKENEGEWPGKYITPEGVSFEHEINRFKRTIEFRTDVETDEKFGFQIKSLIKKSVHGAVKVEFTDRFNKIGREAKFYCYVNSAFSGIRKLCDWVAAYKTLGDTLLVDAFVEDKMLILSLLHKNSRMTGGEQKFNGLSGDFKSVRETLFSVCDFEMSGLLNEEMVRIVALDKETKAEGSSIITPTKIIQTQDSIEGVSYLLKFHLQ
ncbi:MAG: hypothetical protein Q4B68_06040 [Bacteroidales bacterium]|nr:hypothetical protein [Bacteroidales bacterium]